MRWQRAIFSVELCIHRQHCAVNWIKVGKIIRHLRLPQFAVRHLSTYMGHERFQDTYYYVHLLPQRLSMMGFMGVSGIVPEVEEDAEK